MKKRYCINYVGNDSRSHRVSVWANDHHAAIREVKKMGGIDEITGVRKKSNPFVMVGIVLVALVLVIIELIN